MEYSNPPNRGITQWEKIHASLSKRPDFKNIFTGTQLTEHQRLDHIVKDTYWENGRGCAVGCTLEAVATRNGKWRNGIDHSDHALYVSELGIPEQLAYLQDAIFEGLPDPDYLDWPQQFVKAIPTGADLSGVWPKFVVALLTDPTGPLWPLLQDDAWRKQRFAVEKVASIYRNGMPSVKTAEAAAGAARAAEAAEAAAFIWQRDLLLRFLSDAGK